MLKVLELPEPIEDKYKRVHFKSLKYKQEDDEELDTNPFYNPLLEGQVPAWKFKNPSFRMSQLRNPVQEAIAEKTKAHQKAIQSAYIRWEQTLQPQREAIEKSRPKPDDFRRLKAKYDQDRDLAKNDLEKLEIDHQQKIEKIKNGI